MLRIFIWRLKNLCVTVLAVLLTVGVLLVIGGSEVCRFSTLEGKRVFYLDSASSQGLQKEELVLADLAKIKGESVYFSLPRDVDTALIVQAIAEEYHAEIIWKETACGVTSYYCHTLQWADGVFLYGAKINLHIAVGNGVCAVGSPIVFGGF